LEAADGGTLFLDEIAELHPKIQAKLLRVLEEREFYPLGSTRKKKVDIRVLAASNQDLWERTESGQFRKDLFFRLATIRIELPSLRQRKDDILPLTQFFVEQFNDKYGKSFRSISPGAEHMLLSHPWPGNIRELRNAIERIILLEKDETILEKHLQFLNNTASPKDLSAGGNLVLALPDDGMALGDLEKEVILKAYEKCAENKSKTARFLRIPRHVLLYRLKKYGIKS